MSQRRRIIATVLGFAFLTAPAWGAADGGDDELRRLIARLSTDDWKEREQLAARIAEFGDLALPPLRDRLVGEDDPQVRVTIDALIKRVTEAEKSAPTRVTLKLTGVKGSEAIAELAKAAGITWAPGSEGLGGDGPVDVDLTRTPLWDALAVVGGKCGVTFDGIDEQGRVMLRPVSADAPPPPTWVSGPFMVTLSRLDVTVTRSKDFGGPRGAGVAVAALAQPPLRVALQAWAEPRLKPLSFAVESAECATDAGAVPPPNARVALGTSSLSGRVNSRYETQLRLGAPPERATTIERLRLKAQYVLQRKIETIEVPDLMSGKEVSKSVGGIRIVVRGMAKLPGEPVRYSYTMQLHRDGRPVNEWQAVRSMIYQFPVKVVDDKGAPLLPFGSSTSMSGDTYTMTHTLSAANGQGEPSKLLWEFPTETHVAATEVEFRDVPLP